MRTRNWAFALIFAMLGLVNSACNKTTGSPVENQQVAKTDKPGASIYPHDKDFFKLHGQSYLQNKPQCLSCHGADGAGGTAKISCLGCHANFPHPRDWVLVKNHSAQFMKDTQSCASCHGGDSKGGKSQVSCFSCHANFPHPKGWAVPDQHGKAFAAIADKSSCLACHNPANTSNFATSCNTCHSAFPHGKGFVMGGHAALARTYAGKCLSCHRDYKENMPKMGADGGCLSCHDGKIQIHWQATPPSPHGKNNILKSKRLPSSR